MPDNEIRKSKDRQLDKKPFLPVKDQRELAKLGMVTSMGTLLVSGFMGRESSRLHIGSGLALIGFSYWHYRLYQPKSR